MADWSVRAELVIDCTSVSIEEVTKRLGLRPSDTILVGSERRPACDLYYLYHPKDPREDGYSGQTRQRSNIVTVRSHMCRICVACVGRAL